jgi:hypothetical protein
MSLKAELERIMERIEELKSEPLRNKKDKDELEGLQLDRDEILMRNMNKGSSAKKKTKKKKGYADTRQITGASKVKKDIRKKGIVNRENPKFGFRNPSDPPGHFPYPYKSAEPTKAVRINIEKNSKGSSAKKKTKKKKPRGVGIASRGYGKAMK